MIITNMYDLPHSFVEFMQRDYMYQPNEYRVTSLLRGLKETILLRRHNDEIEVDIADMIWLLFGTAVHLVLEQSSVKDSELKEERLKVPFGDYILSGQFDLYCSDDKCVTDYKTTSVYKIIKQNYSDWTNQLSVYAYMLETYGFPVECGKIIPMLKDHSKAEANKPLAIRKPNYPQHPVAPIKFSITETDKKNAHKFIEEQFAKISEYEKMEDDDIPECLPNERWISDWAVMKKGQKRATRVFETEEEGWAWVDENIKDEDLENITVYSRGDKKCNEYCYVNKFCHYYRENYMEK